MLQLIKQDLFINTWITYLSILLFLSITYFVFLPPIFMFIATALTLIIALFYYDDRANVNKFLRSLPIQASQVVKRRYQSIMLLSICIILYQWIIGYAIISFTDLDRYIYGWKDIIVCFSIGVIIIAITVPFFYLFRSFTLSVGCLMVLLMLGSYYSLTPLVTVLELEEVIIFNELDPGFVLVVEKYIPYQPFIILVLASVVIFYLSMKLSQLLYLKKDL
ncbi:hypothetical protein CIL05_04325 [Virgibacillus profundi]|uniref:Uncharacterized protein n=1 Tax=Virgibacillus profundi TaxID=2024555 RepID=A0A2A2IH38_9BACI|nr:ABC-2 transporter permease [Virgibacillus profundi]PAV30947.1 hypothetical protein CIL05_04325 [Virgibacillus profundi]PXY55132.1 ABC-2 transporter permease [Virgibacillus profundi]